MSKLSFRSVLLIVALIFVVSLQVVAAGVETIDAYILTKDAVKIKQAISLLEDSIQKNPSDGQTQWLMAKAHLYLGDQTDEGRLAIFEAGKSYAEAAVELLPESPHTHYWLSALIGRIGQTRGVLSSLFMVRPMKDALDRVLELDENYADAHWVLSQLYQEAPGFPLSIGNKKLALEHVTIAVNLDPNNVEYQLQLARALEYNNRNAEALAVVDDLLKMPALEKEPEIKADAQALQAKLGK